MNTNAFSTPPVDILESDADFLLTLDLPGVKKENASVEIQDGRLTIEATKGENGSAVTYRRAFTLDRGLDEDGMTAELDRGVLVIRVPKAPEKKPLQIPVAVS